MTATTIEKCNCEQALYYEKKGKELANALLEHDRNTKEKYGNRLFTSDRLVTIAKELLQEA